MEVDAASLERLLPEVDLAQSVFESMALRNPGHIDWEAALPAQVGPYILRHLKLTFEIIKKSGKLPLEMIVEFAKAGCNDEELPYSRQELQFLKHGFLITYLRYQEAFFAVPFEEGEHRILNDYETVPFVLLPKDMCKRRAGCFGEVTRVMEGEKSLCVKALPAGDLADREHKFLAEKVPKAPHLLKLRASYIQKGKHSLILEPWVDTDLKKLLEHPRGFPWWIALDNVEKTRMIVSWMACTSAALVTLHSHKIKHVDLKPDNIGLKLNEAEVEPYILDYGLSVSFTSCSGMVTAGGAPFHSSPEKAGGKKEGRKGHIFSLAVIFMEMLGLLNSQFMRRWKTLVKNRAPARVVCIPGWDDGLFLSSPLMDDLSTLLRKMLSCNPDVRPSAANVWEFLTVMHKDYDWPLHCDTLVVKTPSPPRAPHMAEETDDEESEELVDEDVACDTFVVRRILV